MKKVLLLCCSDILGIPAILRMKQQNMLAAIAITDKIKDQFIPVLQDVGFSTDDIHILSKRNLAAELKNLIDTYHPDALFALTFSWMIPNVVLDLLPKRCINFHFGLLPKYKGAEPIFWQIRNGEQRGGISIHIMTDELDNGAILSIEELPIFPGETYGLYAQRLGAIAADATIKILNELDTLEALPAMPANEPHLFFNAPSRSDLTINWQLQTVTEIECLVNAANPRYSGAITSIRQSQINFFEVAPADVDNPNDIQYPPGTIIHADLLYGLLVACINKQFLKINVASIQQGYFSGSKLFNMGFTVGETFV